VFGWLQPFAARAGAVSGLWLCFVWIDDLIRTAGVAAWKEHAYRLRIPERRFSTVRLRYPSLFQLPAAVPSGRLRFRLALFLVGDLSCSSRAGLCLTD